MPDGSFPIPPPINEPVRDYAPGAPERLELKARLGQMLGETVDIPVVVGGREIRTGRTQPVVCPHDHRHVLGHAHMAGPDEVAAAVGAAAAAWREWSEMAWEARAAIFLRAAELLAGPWRATLNAATMLNQSKTAYQAEIDAACELIDFWRFNTHFAEQIHRDQPRSAPGVWNYLDYRPLEGFVFAVSPFNFTSIAGNLPTAPAIMGNTVLWKPASTALLSGHYLMRLFQAAGLPDGVINFLPGRGAQVGDPVLASPALAGIHFTGSTPVFQEMWRTIGANIASYRGYPRIVGETGGKDFVFAHPSADVQTLATALIRGAFEYQGQKCSAPSRAYLPQSLWPQVRSAMSEQLAQVAQGSPLDFRNFVCAVIDERSFERIGGAIAEAKAGPGYELIAGGGSDKTDGYFIEPTVVRADDPRCRLMTDELFGPLLTLYVYPDRDLAGALELCDNTSPYALTGAIFAEDRRAIVEMSRSLRFAAGNFYINDKPTGAVVGQQPFGGARASGTNDKAGSAINLLRWTSARAIKETFVPPGHFAYPSMAEE